MLRKRGVTDSKGNIRELGFTRQGANEIIDYCSHNKDDITGIESLKNSMILILFIVIVPGIISVLHVDMFIGFKSYSTSTCF
jgi:hypothetical protein